MMIEKYVFARGKSLAKLTGEMTVDEEGYGTVWGPEATLKHRSLFTLLCGGHGDGMLSAT